MVDYTQPISGSSTMMIRDTGSDVEFWFRTGEYTWNNDQQWRFVANGHNSGIREFRLLRGGNWQKFGEVRVTYDQNVSFTIYDAGLGFPTHTFTHHIARSTPPQSPNLREATAISSSQIFVRFTGRYDGGSPVVQWQIGYGSLASGPSYSVASDGTTNVGGFNPGQRVYFWARGRNSLGWSEWSNRREATTWKVPDAPAPVTFSNVGQTYVQVQFKDRGIGGTAILERQIGYSVTPTAPDTFVEGLSSVHTLTGLQPGGTYYFWGRSRNAVGWGSWSARTQLNLVAGARVRHEGSWKRAIPYVRVDGVWKVAEPWIRKTGVWRRTSM